MTGMRKINKIERRDCGQYRSQLAAMQTEREWGDRFPVITKSWHASDRRQFRASDLSFRGFPRKSTNRPTKYIRGKSLILTLKKIPQIFTLGGNYPSCCRVLAKENPNSHTYLFNIPTAHQLFFLRSA